MKAIGYVIAYALPSAVVWGVIAIIIHPLANVAVVPLLLALIYALIFGAIEALALPLRPWSSSWQVPAQWLKGRSALAQTLIWGATLGPGLMTRNPYASMWLLPIFLTFSRDVMTDLRIGILMGAVHGGARAIGVLRTSHRTQGMSSMSLLLMTQWRWRVADGLLLLIISGSLASPVLMDLHAHL